MNNLGGSGARAGPLPNAAPLEPPAKGTRGFVLGSSRFGRTYSGNPGCALAPPSTAEPPALPPNRSPGGTGKGAGSEHAGLAGWFGRLRGSASPAFRHVNPTLGPNGWQAGMAGAGARGRTGHPRQQRRKREQTLHVFRERPDAGPASLQSLCWVSHLCVSRLPLNEASKGRRTCALRKRVAHGAKHPAHKTGLGAVAHLVGPGDPGGADKDFWVRPPPSPGGGGEEAGEPCREPPVDGTEPSQPASQRDREMEEQRRAARLHGRAPSQTSPPNWGMGGRAGPDGGRSSSSSGSRRGSPPAARSRGSPPVVVGAALSPHDRGQGPLGPGGHGRQPLRRPRQPGPPKACPAFGDGSRKGRGRQNNIRLQTPRRTPHAMGPWPQLALQGSAPEASKQASTNGSRQEAS
ncbi:hypothetical protein C7M84_018109 [Penaeus vannamei]|uniref:Uncharacterized protein n=1 Tax=Penaeus vannamei TaxID=6689 RepID=A0A3R7QDD0_PENVA|nr:hypothetical protein C7M84_018109 [Penaeus vannamei]